MDVLKSEGKLPFELNIIFISFPVEAYISNSPTSCRLGCANKDLRLFSQVLETLEV